MSTTKRHHFPKNCRVPKTQNGKKSAGQVRDELINNEKNDKGMNDHNADILYALVYK